ncbi:hypothetical protein AQJ66_00865 [Streptomyces bungoensis]|uniref:LmbE family protein n=1 Tax=Streptomyces bungoensis TaxID=285568 RepID=A0A124I5K1_9ACTN|nr:hypothetical protein [Streptomyces bungoensis]KUN90179.1 hypothetical protein AQJ66_00865 [Streptomyces bungoensis]
MRTRSGRGAARGRVDAEAHRVAEVGHTAKGTVGGRWLLLGRDGRLTAYARTGEGLLRWTESRRGGPEWTGPDFFPVAGLTHLTVAQGADTYVHFLGRREVRRADGPPVVDIVHAIQYQTGRAVTEWRSLGNAHKDREKAARFGVPVAAVSGSGRVHVFTRNAGGGVMLRREGSTGKWEPWQDLKGSGVRDGIAAVAHPSGCIEVLAAGETTAMRWRQGEADGDFRQQPNIPVRVVPGTASALPSGPERATFYWADPDVGGLVAHRPGQWAIPLGGVPDGEPVAVLRAGLDGYDCTVLAHRDVDGQVMLAVCGTENEQAGLWWAPTGERSLGAPALALDGHGRVALAVIDPAGMLCVARQTDEPGLSLTPWARV